MAYCIDSLDFNNGELCIEKKELRKSYNEYCKLYKIKVQGDKSIKNTFDIHFGVQEDSRKRIHDELFHVWDGVSFKKGNEVTCKLCQGFHGFQIAIGMKDLAYKSENGGKGGTQSKLPEKDSPIFPVEMDNILLKCSVCGAPPPCNFTDVKGKPVCEFCASIENVK